jgi:hypothetical protein
MVGRRGQFRCCHRNSVADERERKLNSCVVQGKRRTELSGTNDCDALPEVADSRVCRARSLRPLAELANPSAESQTLRLASKSCRAIRSTRTGTKSRIGVPVKSSWDCSTTCLTSTGFTSGKVMATREATSATARSSSSGASITIFSLPVARRGEASTLHTPSLVAPLNILGGGPCPLSAASAADQFPYRLVVQQRHNTTTGNTVSTSAATTADCATAVAVIC